MKKIILLSILVICFASLNLFALEKPVVSMKAHEAQGFKCADCHGTDNPEKKPKTEQCVECHDDGSGTYKGKNVKVENYAERAINPHDSHLGDVRCTKCHGYHKPSTLACNEGCHDYKLEVK